MLPVIHNPNSNSSTRERRSWTTEEDQLLREAVQKEDPDNMAPSRWFAIAKHVPGRTNKDCRKRWFAKMASDVVKGGWAPDEDERLCKAIQQVGTRWSMVAAYVQTRNSDQCAKRWTDTLNPAIDRTTWTPEGDAMLLKAVDEHGKLWTKIVKLYFPGRTGLSAKNRYNSITRSHGESRSGPVRGPSTSTRPPRQQTSPSASPHLQHPHTSTSNVNIDPQLLPRGMPGPMYSAFNAPLFYLRPHVPQQQQQQAETARES